MIKNKTILCIILFICAITLIGNDDVAYCSHNNKTANENNTVNYEDDADLLKVGLYFSEKKYTEVIHICRKILNSYPKHLVALKYIITAYNELGQPSFAIEYYKRYCEIDYENADVHLLGAELYLKSENYQEAINKSFIAINLGVETIYRAFYLIAVSQKNLNDISKSLYYAELSIKHNDRFVPSYYLLAELYESSGLFNDAELIYYELKRIDRKNIIPDVSLSLLYYKMGMVDKSKDLVRDFLLGKLNGFPYFIYSLNKDYAHFISYKNIIEAFFNLYKERQNDTALNRNVGYLYYLLGDYISAMYYFRRARILFSDMDFSTEFYISLILYHTGELEKSIELLKKINDNFPNNLDVYSLLGYLYHRINRDDVGIRFINKALSLNSENSLKLNFYLSLNYIGLNKLNEAKEIINKIKGKRYIPEYYLISSYLSAELRNFDDSYKNFKKYISLKKNINKNVITEIFAEKSFLKMYNQKDFTQNINELIIKNSTY